MIGVKVNCQDTKKTPKGVDALAKVIVFTIVFFAYSIVIFSTFGVMDDWNFLYNAISGQTGTIPLLIGAGRPLNAFLFDFGFSAAGSVENLALLRFATVIGISILGVCLYTYCRSQGLDFITSMCISIGVVLLPSYHVYASWAQHFTTPYAGVLGICSAYFVTPQFRMRHHSRALAIFCSAILLLFSLLIYQPIAMLFWTAILISVMSNFDSDNRWTISSALDAFVAFAVAMIVAFIAFKVGQIQYPSDSSRYGLVSDIYGKLLWFVSEPLANVSTLYVLPKKSFVQLTVAVFFLTALLILVKMRGIGFVVRVMGIIVGSWFLSYIPSLATAENWASYRSTGALSATFLVSFILILRLPIKHFLKMKELVKITPSLWKFLSIFVASILIFLVAFTQNSVNKGFVLPNVIELNNLSSFLKDKNLIAADAPAIIVKTSSWQDSSARVLLYDEFGMHSSLRDYYAIPMVKIVLRSMGLMPDSRVSLKPENLPNDKYSADDESILIDFTKLVTNERFRSNLSDWKGEAFNLIYPANINDVNWSAGLWTNEKSPGSYSFTYKRRYGDIPLRVGDRLLFKKSGVRIIGKVETNGDYVNVFTDGDPLVVGDGFPSPVIIINDARAR